MLESEENLKQDSRRMGSFHLQKETESLTANMNKHRQFYSPLESLISYDTFLYSLLNTAFYCLQLPVNPCLLDLNSPILNLLILLPLWSQNIGYPTALPFDLSNFMSVGVGHLGDSINMF